MASLQQMYREIESQREMLELILRNQHSIMKFLIEYHGELIDTDAPALRASLTKTQEFLRDMS